MSLLTEEEYLSTEELSPVRREYVDGFVYAQAGASLAHNQISSNLQRIFQNAVYGGPCRVYTADMKVRVRGTDRLRYYSPNFIVVCIPHSRLLTPTRQDKTMFTLEQINALHSRFGRAQTFLEYVRAFSAIGVNKYDSYIADGHSEYFGSSGEQVNSPAVHEELAIAETSNRKSFLEHLRLHEQGETGYLEMSRGLAESGIEKWTVDVGNTTMTYYDRAGNEMLVENIE